MEDTGIHREIGRHDAQIESLQEQVRLLHKDMQQMNTLLQAIQSTLSEARGGWRTLMLVGGVSATFGAFLIKLTTWLGAFPK